MQKNKRKSGNSSRSFHNITLAISTSLVLILVGIVVLSVITAHNLSNYVKENLCVTLYLNKDLTDSQAQGLALEMKKKKYVADMTFLSKEQVSKEQKKELGADPSDFIGSNPFSAEIELHLNAVYANNDSLQWIRKTLTKDERVSEVAFQENLIDQVNNTLSKINIGLLVLAGVLTIISFSLINNTVRLGVYARRFAIRTMKLVGASWSFIRWPFLRNALAVGFISSLIACCVLGGAVYLFASKEPDVRLVITDNALIITAGVILVFGMLITFFCAFLSVNKFLKMKASDLYKI